MTDRMFDLTRRKILAGVGAVGVAGAGAGLGTSALFSDTESVEDNTITAGQLNLVVDFFTSRDQGQAGTDSQSGEVDGNGATVYTYDVTDVKPGDSGTLAFCPKVVDNPGYVWVGSEEGATDYENGQTEPESEGDATGGGTLGGSNDGAGAGELSELIEVTVSYAESITYNAGNDEVVCNNTRELNNPGGYSLADLAKDLKSGFQLDGNEPNDGDNTVDAYPGSSGPDDQQGPCLCIEWELPVEVGNEVQSDAVTLPFQFAAVQERNNPTASNPFVDVTVGPSGGSTSYDFNSIQTAIDDSGTSAGDVIGVAADTYEELITVDKEGLVLVGTGGTPTIAPSEDLPPANSSRNNVVRVDADGVCLDGLAVDGDNTAIGSSGSIEAIIGVYVPDSTGVQIRNSAVRNTNDNSDVTIGVWAESGAAVDIDRTEFDNHQTGVFIRNSTANVTGCRFTDVGRGINTNFPSGTTVDGKSYGTFSGNVIEADSLGIRLNAHGFSFAGSSPWDYTVVDNEVSGATEGINLLTIGANDGNEATRLVDVTVEGNVVSDCVRGYDLTALTTDEEIRIDGGEVTDCDTGLIAFSDNGAFSGAQYAGPADNLIVGSGVSFSNNTDDIVAYGADVTMIYEGSSASTSAQNGATIN